MLSSMPFAEKADNRTFVRVSFRMAKPGLSWYGSYTKSTRPADHFLLYEQRKMPRGNPFLPVMIVQKFLEAGA
jgi:hypothetical protein